MKPEDIEALAREAGFTRLTDGLRDDERSDYFDCWPEQLHKFAALVLERAADTVACIGIDGIPNQADDVVAEYLRAMAEGLKV